MILPSMRLENKFWDILSHIQLKDYEVISVYDKVLSDILPLIVPDDEKKLIDLAFQPKLTQQQLDEFLQNWDIERYGAQKALLLAYVQKKWSQLDFGAYTGPRLKGLRAYYRFHNLELMAQYRKIVGALNQQNIIPMIIKGGAMRYLRSDLPRAMGDIDILISDKAQFKQAVAISKAMGYIALDAGHSVDLYKDETKKESVLDIHHCIDDHFKNYDFLNQEILARAHMQDVFGVKSFVPQNEDLVFVLLFNLGKNLVEYSSISGIMYIVFDLAYLTSKPDFNWQIVRQNMELTSTCWQIYLAAAFVNKMVKGLLPDLLNGTDFAEISYELNKRYFYARYIHKPRYRRKELYLWKVVCGKQSLNEYIKVKGQYQLLKYIWRSPFLLKMFFQTLKKVKQWNM